MTSINPFTVLLYSPSYLMTNEHDQNEQNLFSMLKNMLAPYYKFKSLTTILMSISIIVYITLVFRYPPFLKIPTFALEQLVLLPQHLKHFQFYRLFTAPFVYQDVTTLIIGVLILWSIGSYTEEIMGPKYIIAFSCLSGLVGYSDSFTLPIFLIGCNFSLWLMKWPDPNTPIIQRKIYLFIFIIVIIVFILFFVSYKKQQKFNFYASAVYGFLLTSIIGKIEDARSMNTFRKLLSTSSLIIFILINFLLLQAIVFYGKTFI